MIWVTCKIGHLPFFPLAEALVNNWQIILGTGKWGLERPWKGCGYHSWPKIMAALSGCYDKQHARLRTSRAAGTLKSKQQGPYWSIRQERYESQQELPHAQQAERMCQEFCTAKICKNPMVLKKKSVWACSNVPALTQTQPAPPYPNTTTHSNTRTFHTSKF